MGHQTTVLKPMVLGIPDFKNPPYKNGGLKHVQIYIYIHGYITHISRNQIEHGVLVHVWNSPILGWTSNNKGINKPKNMDILEWWYEYVSGKNTWIDWEKSLTVKSSK